jgi:hypothetical protein
MVYYDPSKEESAQDVFVKLSHIYFVGCIIILSVGGAVLSKVLYVFFGNYSKLNAVVKSYLSVILPDVLMVVNFLPRDIYNLHMGSLQGGEAISPLLPVAPARHAAT